MEESLTGTDIYDVGRVNKLMLDAAESTIKYQEQTIATLTAQRDAAEKVCEEAEHHVGICGGGKLRRLLTTWRRTKEGA